MSKLTAKQWYYNNIEKAKENNKRWQENNKERKKEYDKIKWQNNKDKIKEKHKQWLEVNPNYYKMHYEKNKDKYRESCKRNQEYHNKYKRDRRKINPKFKLDGNIGWMIWKGLKKEKSGISWTKLVPYTREELVKHLEKQFRPEMNWDNYGDYWVVDHIIPRCVFNYINPKDIDFKRCWALNNLQPLPTEINLKKGSKLTKPFQPALAIAI